MCENNLGIKGVLYDIWWPNGHTSLNEKFANS